MHCKMFKEHWSLPTRHQYHAQVKTINDVSPPDIAKSGGGGGSKISSG